MTSSAPPAPLSKSATVPCPPQRAFELFTREMSSWWPLATHSVGEDASSAVEVQGYVGGHIVETLQDGTTSVWGTVTAWEPPARVAFTWHPGRDAAYATTVEVTFAVLDSGPGTTVTLVQGGWSARPDGVSARTDYDTGWELVLGSYRDAAIDDLAGR